MLSPRGAAGAAGDEAGKASWACEPETHLVARRERSLVPIPGCSGPPAKGVCKPHWETCLCEKALHPVSCIHMGTPGPLGSFLVAWAGTVPAVVGADPGNVGKGPCNLLHLVAPLRGLASLPCEASTGRSCQRWDRRTWPACQGEYRGGWSPAQSSRPGAVAPLTPGRGRQGPWGWPAFRSSWQGQEVAEWSPVCPPELALGTRPALWPGAGTPIQPVQVQAFRQGSCQPFCAAHHSASLIGPPAWPRPNPPAL